MKALEGHIGGEAELERVHSSLTAHFDALRAARSDGPIYLLEHDLSEADLLAVLRSVQVCLRRHRIEGSWWDSHSLPLLVAATEIGYIYRGTGTDFWPIFSKRLGEISLADRSELSSLFRRSTARFGFAAPADSPWNRAFCHIAWPVLHAILPIELHRPLARALRDVRTHLDLSGSDAALIAPIRNRAHLGGGGRLAAWLEDQRTAAAVVRQFLDPSHQHAIANSAVGRIAADLANDEIAKVALRDARKRQKALMMQPVRRVRGKIPVEETRFAQLVLRSTDQGLLLALKFPQLDVPAREVAREALDAIRWRAFLWGRGQPVPSRNIFSDYPVPLNVALLPPTDAPLIERTGELPVPPEAKEFLDSLRVNTSTPILFSDFTAEDDAFQRLSKSVIGNSHVVVLIADENPPKSAEFLGRVAGLRVYKIDVGQPDGVEWLENYGWSVYRSSLFSFVGEPELEQHRPKRRFRLNSYIAFEVTAVGAACTVHLIKPDGSESHIDGTDRILAGFDADQIGIYKIQYGAGESKVFEVVPYDDDEGLVSVDIAAGTGAIADLVERQVVLRFESEASLQEAEVELRLLSDSRECARATRTLPDTPCCLNGDDILWDSMLTEEVLERLLLSKTVELRVLIKGLVDSNFRFEQAAAPFAWRQDAVGNLTAVNETGEMALFFASPQNPLDVMPSTGGVSGPHITLYRAGNRIPHITGGLCVGPKVWHASDEHAAPMPTRLLRQFEARRGDAADAHSVVEALLSWSAASVDHPITQMRRGRVVQQLDHWLVRQLCGADWADRESKISKSRETSFAPAFLQVCKRLQVGYAKAGLSQTQCAHLDRILLRLLERRGLSVLLHESCIHVDQEVGAALDDLFNNAYTILHLELTSLGDGCPFDPDEDIDVGETSEDWERARCAASSETAIVELVDLLRPLGAGELLSRSDFDVLLPDDVIDLLHRWIATHGPSHHVRHWSSDLVESAYWLFAKPSVASRLSWRGATERLLADGFSARAIRYAALRMTIKSRNSL
ncbi:hypothetical protein PPMP20_09000 [Paraburkholderia phymatum]|uniref:Uncharacterized protein n=1 Tax=Paraburkholderia phymatum (strain DSM 17167 / CIP 108236 / LMG 21445 / STM815) TaxID=391038 RepID=B2JC65_PARP8|nr:hypothetical protein [Paraburkholderia phymatum]ACC69429.1 hypothetical protein Bphy_0236 [Paraburkholderia phymatum STM815]